MQPTGVTDRTRPRRGNRPAASRSGRAAALAAATVVLATSIAGCGYRFVRSVAVPSDVRTISVRVTAPERSDPMLADALAREIRRVLRWNGRFRPVESGPADAELVLRVTTDRLRAVAFDEFDQVLDYQQTIAVDAELRRGGDAVLWSADRIAATRGQAAVQGAIVTSSSSFQGGDIVSRKDLGKLDGVQLGEERKTAARDAVLRDLAETVYSRMTEGF
jgi:outer membrane lipopolysaccharide assembly protein LptE/RlpB